MYGRQRTRRSLDLNHSRRKWYLKESPQITIGLSGGDVPLVSFNLILVYLADANVRSMSKADLSSKNIILLACSCTLNRPSGVPWYLSNAFCDYVSTLSRARSVESVYPPQMYNISSINAALCLRRH